MKAAPKIERAIGLVMTSFADKRRIGPTSIPSCTHSLRVGLSLCAYHYPLEVILGGFCHDLIEDTEVTHAMIARLFSPRVGFLVEACTLDPKLGDTPEGEDDLFVRVTGMAGRGDVEPLIIKCADSMDSLKTNEHLRPDWQLAAYRRGDAWWQAARNYLPHDARLLADHGNVLAYEAKRLGLTL